MAKMITDPQRKRKSDPGDPGVCNVFEFHKIYTEPEKVAEIDPACRSAEIGCVECKKIMADSLARALAPIREKRAYYEGRPRQVEEIMEEGSRRARKTARQTMEQVRQAVGLA